MFLASPRLATNAPLCVHQPQQVPSASAWSVFDSPDTRHWGFGSFLNVPYAMPTPPPPTTAAPSAPSPIVEPAFTFQFNAANDTSNPFAVALPHEKTAAVDSGLGSVHATSRNRGSKFAPLLQRKNPEEQRKKRRDAYMANVRERSDVARWETRGESSLQRDFFEEQRAWEQEQARVAEQWMLDPDEMEDAVPEDEVAMEEDVPEDDGLDWAAAYDENRSSYDSDDELDALMLEMATQTDGAATDIPPTETKVDASSRQMDDAMASSAEQAGQIMDMSLG